MAAAHLALVTSSNVRPGHTVVTVATSTGIGPDSSRAESDGVNPWTSSFWPATLWTN